MFPRRSNEAECSGVRTLIVTGAGGYLGSRLVATARADGRRVTSLARPAWHLGEGLPADAIDPAVPRDTQAVIHLAHDWQDDGANLEGTRALLRSCREAGIGRFVFVSSQSAREDAANRYGRVKWGIEQELRAPNEVAARVGLVYGGRMHGQYGLLSALTRRTPVLPMIDPWREVQPIHIDEVCRGLLLLADGAQVGWVGLAGEPVRFDVVLRAMARELHGKRLRVVPVPLRLALLACDASAAIPIGPTVDRERVLGLAGTRTMACAGHLAGLGLAVQPIEAGLRREPASRRALLAEGLRLLRYVLRRAPGSSLLRRYVRALEAAGDRGPLPGAGGWLRLVEPVRSASPLGRRLALACALAEASPEGEDALSGGSVARRMGALALHGVADALAMPVRLVQHGLRR